MKILLTLDDADANFLLVSVTSQLEKFVAWEEPESVAACERIINQLAPIVFKFDTEEERRRFIENLRNRLGVRP